MLSVFQAQQLQAQESQLEAQKITSALPVITLASSDADTKVKAAVVAVVGETEAARRTRLARANYREFEKVNVHESSQPKQLVLEFHAQTKITGVSVTGDFKVTGGNCAQGAVYLAGGSCEVEVTFTPSAPGHRAGQLKVENTAQATPFLTPIGGTASGPAISFTPSVTATLAGSYVGGSTGGLISGLGQLATDGNDNLYIADPGNHLVRFRDSGGVISTLIGGGTTSLTSDSSAFGTQVKLSAPTGVTVDTLGTVYFSDNIDKLIGTYFIDSIALRSVGLGATAENGCYTGSKCTPSAVALDPPTTLAIDPSGNVFVASTYGSGLPGSEIAEYTTQASTPQFYEVGTTAYNYYSTSNALTTDPFGYGNLYYTYLDPGGPILSPTPLCYILGQNSAYTQDSTSGRTFWEVAGSGKCGFSGDGGRAGSAEISKAIGQFAWDAAGNFYFTDTGNNRVRRVDSSNGVIRTIAGSGATGIGGDGGPSTAAQIGAPIGLATDSTGAVYATTLTTVANKYAIRTFGTVGDLNFGSVVVATPTPAQTVLISNVGNAELDFAHTAIASGNTGDFAVDPNTTSCNFTAPLQSGQSCNVGFIFTPTAAGARSATFSLLDNTISGTNTIQLTGTGETTATLTPAAVTFASEPVGSATAATVLTLKNTGSGVLGINTGGITITGTGAASFSETTTCGTTLAAGASCTISAIFKPTVTGTLSATLAVVDNALGGSQKATLTGTATAAAVAKLALSPASTAFASQTVGTASAAKSITLTNSGTAAATLSAFAISGTNATSFTQTHTCGTTLAAGASCTISVVFKPAAAGNLAATLTVTSSAGTLTSALTGTSVAAAAKVTLAATPESAVTGQWAKLTAHVTGSGATGLVQFKDQGQVLGDAALNNGVAVFDTTTLASGMHMMSADYPGDARNTGAASTVIQMLVRPRMAVGPVMPQ